MSISPRPDPDHAEWYHALTPAERLAWPARERLAWVAPLEQALALPAGPTAAAQEARKREGLSDFLEVVDVLIAHARERLSRSIRASFPIREGLPFDPESIERVLFTNHVGWLMVMLSRTLVLELHVARLQGVLEGHTPNERFESFVRRTRRPEHLQVLLKEYPVLARQVMMCLDQWVQTSLELLHRLCADWDLIRSVFSPDTDPGVVEALSGSLGDRHRSGRTVQVVRFNSGLQLVYKPRSQAVTVHFNELLSWINERGAHPSFRTLKVIDSGTHGWVEFVSAQPCRSVGEVKRFYTRQGGYLALMYTLGATDMHFENLIAVGEHPVMIDLEALFHPELDEVGDAYADHFAHRAINTSVTGVGLLPHRSWRAPETEGIDLSGLGATQGQLTPGGVPDWEAAGTDAMRFVRRQVELTTGDHRPTLSGDAVRVLDHVQAICDGFRTLYHLLRNHRTELLAAHGPLAAFADDEIRVILRPTRTYGVLLYESLHPDMLRDARDRDRFMDHLRAEVEHRPYLATVIDAEREDLQRGDIPLFTTRPSARSVWTSSGRELPDFLAEPGLDVVERRVRHLSAEDLEKQLWLIKASLSTLAQNSDHRRSTTGRVVEGRRAVARRDLLRAAEQVGDRLRLLAVRAEEEATWLALRPVGDRHAAIGPMSLDLYDGLPGVVLFLAFLGEVAQADRFTGLARAGLTTLRKQIREAQSTLSTIGGFSGWGGLIYTFVQLGTLWSEPDLLAEAEAMVDHLPPLIEADERLDIIGGSAGCILALSSLYRYTASPRARAAAIQCGERLLASARPMAEGIGWPTGEAGVPPLVGFSHGAAGITCALLELAALTRQDRFRVAAEAGMRYERSLYAREHKNWPDLRYPDREAVFMSAWCHGAPGIGLARLHALQYIDDGTIRYEIATALETTCATGFGGNHSLCHGDLGNLDLLLQASHTLDETAWCERLNTQAGHILHSIEAEGWRCGTALETEVPGLMTGISGIGYELLRLAEPSRVPSVLVLASLNPSFHKPLRIQADKTLVAV